MMFFYRFLYVFIWPLFRLLFHPKVRGRENIPKSGAIIFAGNHKSNLDCFFAGYVPVASGSFYGEG